MAFDLAPLKRRWIGIVLLVLFLGLPAGAYFFFGPARRPAADAARPPAPQAHRIVSLVPAVTEMLFAIGAGDRLIAVSSFDTYPPDVAHLTRVGALLDPDLERIFALRPDLVVVYGSQGELRAQLARAGIASFVYSHGGLADITTLMRELGRRTGRAGEAERAASAVEQDLAAIAERLRGRPRVATLVVIGRERAALRAIYASGGRGFLHDLVNLAGGHDVLADIDRENIQASTELILARAPEVILEIYGAGVMTEAEIARERQVWRALSSVPAVRDDRVYILTGQELVVPGPRIAQAAGRFARALHPEAF
jgi:iron complex transport system substrate-binding protein